MNRRDHYYWTLPFNRGKFFICRFFYYYFFFLLCSSPTSMAPRRVGVGEGCWGNGVSQVKSKPRSTYIFISRFRRVRGMFAMYSLGIPETNLSGLNTRIARSVRRSMFAADGICVIHLWQQHF